MNRFLDEEFAGIRNIFIEVLTHYGQGNCQIRLATDKKYAAILLIIDDTVVKRICWACNEDIIPLFILIFRPLGVGFDLQKVIDHGGNIKSVEFYSSEIHPPLLFTKEQ